MIELVVAVVTTAIVLPLGVYLGTIAERARAEARRPAEPHEVLAEVYEFPTPKAILTELRGPLSGRRSMSNTGQKSGFGPSLDDQGVDTADGYDEPFDPDDERTFCEGCDRELEMGQIDLECDRCTGLDRCCDDLCYAAGRCMHR